MDTFRTTTPRTLHRRLSVRRRSPVVPAAVLTLALLTAACGGEDDAGFDVADQMSMPAPGMPDIAFEGSASFDRGVETVPSVSSSVEGRADDGRAIVRNASIELVVDDGAAAVDAVAAQAILFGGHVTTTALSRDEDGTVVRDARPARACRASGRAGRRARRPRALRPLPHDRRDGRDAGAQRPRCAAGEPRGVSRTSCGRCSPRSVSVTAPSRASSRSPRS